MSCEKDHVFQHKSTVKECVRTKGGKSIFRITDHYQCVECTHAEEKKDFEHSEQPPAWWTRDGREN